MAARRIRLSRFVSRILRCLVTLSEPLLIQVPRFIRWHGWFPPKWEQLLQATSCRNDHFVPTTAEQLFMKRTENCRNNKYKYHQSHQNLKSSGIQHTKELSFICDFLIATFWARRMGKIFQWNIILCWWHQCTRTRRRGYLKLKTTFRALMSLWSHKFG